MSEPIYVAAFPIKLEKWQEDKINRHFKQLCHLQNKSISICYSAYSSIKDDLKVIEDEMCTIAKKEKSAGGEKKKNKKYQELSKKKQELINLAQYNNGNVSSNAKKGKEYSALTKYGIVNIMACIVRNEHLSINSKEVSVLADRVAKSWEKMLWGNGKGVHHQEERDFSTILPSINPEKDRFAKVDWENERAAYLGVEFPFYFKDNDYERSVMEDSITGLRQIGLRRIPTKRGYKWHLLLGVRGTPYGKGRVLGSGDIGIDPGLASVTAYGHEVHQYSGTDKMRDIEARITAIQRYMDRSRRASNPGNFTEDGQIKRGIKLNWEYSNGYKKARAEKRALERKNAYLKKMAQTEFANELLKDGDRLKVEDNRVDSWARRDSGETKINEKTGKCRSKSRGGKSVKKLAPAQLIKICESKIKTLGGQETVKVPEVAACTQFDHTNGENKKRALNERSVVLSNGNVHDRDAHAAFNIKHYDINRQCFNTEAMTSDYENFKNAEAKVYETLKYHNKNLENRK